MTKELEERLEALERELAQAKQPPRRPNLKPLITAAVILLLMAGGAVFTS